MSDAPHVKVVCLAPVLCELIMVPEEAYLACVKQKRKEDSDGEVATLPHKKRGRPLLLGEDIEHQLQLYLNKIREQGEVITASVVMAAARGIVIIPC